ncbi:WD40 repeat-like protein [Fomitiporia mediterranea MF3/22]|uniref:WD40 repeat-like protein n=1 Tax=Fomitiporia mediterranea (strain MF3/22) TaxID=694068 RepID=UPI00044099F2|nr:WD40 repeat-like protein [Fomitiporia mediterranea MF3/22]EJD02027.1 WD40 repeat-like protein [Fomitiporia mediterranea MF3/22]
MPDIPTGAQVFDVCFHPTESLVYTGLLSGGIKAFSYDEQGQHERKFSIRPSKRSCRGLATNEDGSHIYAVGKGKAMHTIDASTGVIMDTRTAIHQAPINRVKRLMPYMLCTGDDDGVVKLWDPRKSEEVRSYDHHFDFISDFMWIGDKKQLVVTSGDGTLSVIDVRSKKPGPLAQSDDQEDELLSIVPIRGGEKTVVGTQQGILSIFNRSSGWGDCVDRVPGHPHSIDALCTIPSSYPSSHSTILTGSSDGLLRAVQLFPTKLLGVIGDHGEFPIERIAIDKNGEGRWVGSVGHDEVVRMTDLREVFEDGNGDEEEEDEKGDEASSDGGGRDDSDFSTQHAKVKTEEADSDSNNESNTGVDADSDEESRKKKRRRKAKVQDPMEKERKKKRRARNDEVQADASFFADL